jgi:serine phosphatase RsbU (regulator of sigma subunit)
MRIRTKLTLVFFLLAVVPLTGIVFYNYISSLKTFRLAVEKEVRAEAEDLSARLDTAKEDLGNRLRTLGSMSLTQSATRTYGSEEERLQHNVDQLGELAPMVSSVEVIPAHPNAPTPVAPIQVPSELHLSEGRVPVSLADSFVIYLDNVVEEVGDAESVDEVREQALRVTETFLAEMGSEVEEAAKAFVEEGEALADEQATREQLVADLDEAIRSEQLSPRERSRLKREQKTAERALGAISRQRSVLEAREVEDLQKGWEKAQRLLGKSFDWEILQDGEVLGQLRAQISPENLLGAVLSRTRRDQGEVPFAVDGEGRIYTASPEDEAILADLEVDKLAGGPEAASTRMAFRRDWLLVTSPDPDSEVVMGIARPLTESLSAMRANAARNFGLGLGMITLALIGIMPLSSRMTRNLTKLSTSVDQMAAGDLDVKVDIQSRDEIGHLAQAVNRMAGDLQENQAQLIGEMQRRKEQETREQLLAAEHERKTSELEEARRFQLSLLPAELPHHRDLEIEVYMQTATEVGGDYYDFVTTQQGQLTVAIGDATGHGATAGTMVTAIKSLFMARADQQEPQVFLTESSETVRRMRLGRMAMALTLARFDEDRLTLAAAGMPPALLWRAETATVEEVTIAGMPLGGLAGTKYQQVDTPFSEGDTALLMTDGFPELANPNGDPLGYASVREQFGAVGGSEPAVILDSLKEKAIEWREDRAILDDITFVVVRRKPRAT